ncbi:MAG: hypothetical protein AAB971_00045 [Patescibacteria group bacterium]
MSKKLMLLIGVVLVAGGITAAVLMMNKDKSSDTKNQSSTQTNTTKSKNQTAETKTAVNGNLKTLAIGGKARECDLGYSGSDGEGAGKLYTDGNGRGRIQLELTTAKGNKGESNTLITGDKVYSWTKTESGAFGFVFDADDVQTNSTGSPTTSNSQTAGKNFSLKCKSWNVEESLVTVPADVNFSALPSSQ